MGALLGKARLVDHDHPLGIPQVLLHIGEQLVPRLVRRPDGAPQQVLEAVGVGVANRLGQLPAVLAPGVAQEAIQVGQQAPTGLGTGHTGSQTGRDFVPAGLPGGHCGRFDGGGRGRGKVNCLRSSRSTRAGGCQARTAGHHHFRAVLTALALSVTASRASPDSSERPETHCPCPATALVPSAACHTKAYTTVPDPQTESGFGDSMGIDEQSMLWIHRLSAPTVCP